MPPFPFKKNLTQSYSVHYRKAKVIRTGSVPVPATTGGNHVGLLPYSKGEGNGLNTPVKVPVSQISSISSEATEKADVPTSSEVADREYGLSSSVTPSMDVVSDVTAMRSLNLSIDNRAEHKVGSSEFF